MAFSEYINFMKVMPKAIGYTLSPTTPQLSGYRASSAALLGNKLEKGYLDNPSGPMLI